MWSMIQNVTLAVPDSYSISLTVSRSNSTPAGNASFGLGTIFVTIK